MTYQPPTADALAALTQELDDARNDDAPDYSWADDLPEAPEIPTDPDATVAVLIPTREQK